jgi:eukaryotic-like serine/threonine-protein kinase
VKQGTEQGGARVEEVPLASEPTDSAQSTTRQRRVIAPGAMLGGYEIEARLGLGGMAEVYAARRSGPHGFSKRVAIKRIVPNAAEDYAFFRMFIHEAEVAARLSHPNVVQVFDFGDDQGELFLAMELVTGTSLGRLLRAVVARGEVFPLPVALYVVGQTARALDYVHRLRGDDGELLGLVHRDVSPGNLLLTQTGHLKLADFGIAYTHQSERHTGSNDLRGKLGYMSPEQVQGLALDGKSDVFTLGVILAELLIGAPMFAGGPQLDVLLRIRDVNLRALDETKRRVPSDVSRLIRDALQADVSQRPDARQLAERIEAICVRRGYPSDASHMTCQLLARYELCDVHPDDAQAGAGRPTSLFGEVPLTDPTAPRIMLRDDAPNVQGVAYCAELRDRPLESVPFPELVRLATTGEIDKTTVIRRDRDAPRPACELPELARVFSTPALQWDAEEIAAPRLRGDMGSASLLPVIASLAHNRETGVLYLDDGKRKKKIYFVEGRPDFVASTLRDELLGNYLVEKGACMPMEMDMALAVMPRHKGRLGDALVSLGVLRPVELYRAVSAQVRARYLEAFRWRRGQFVYVRDKQSREETYPIEQDAHVLMRDACAALHPSEIEAALAPLWEQVLRPAHAPDTTLAAYQVPDAWRWVVAQARGDRTLGAIFARCTLQSGLDAEDAMRALHLAVSCRLLEVA